jgi:ribonuclease HI
MRWRRNGWRTPRETPVFNAELWQRLDAARERHEVKWHWVKALPGTRKTSAPTISPAPA